MTRCGHHGGEKGEQRLLCFSVASAASSHRFFRHGLLGGEQDAAVEARNAATEELSGAQRQIDAYVRRVAELESERASAERGAAMLRTNLDQAQAMLERQSALTTDQMAARERELADLRLRVEDQDKKLAEAAARERANGTGDRVSRRMRACGVRWCSRFRFECSPFSPRGSV